jgi:putative SbcD/Mre11-related phosphoesterase
MRWHDDWLLLPQRFALHEPSATAVLADVHLGYSAARQRLGDAIPSRTVREEMQPLLAALSLHSIRNVIVAGDLFERGYDRLLAEQLLEFLHAHNIAFQGLVPGNHDRGIEKASIALSIFPDGYQLAGWQIAHGDRPLEHAKTVSGHWHPSLRRGRVKTPCFLTNGSQLVLPAFSLDAAGVDIRRDKRWRGWSCYAVGMNEVRAVNA